MELNKKDKAIKYSVYCFVILAAALLQNVSGLFPEIGGARCFLLVPVAILLGLNENEKNAALLGFFAGLLWDSISSQHMGFNCLYLMFFCYIMSAFVNYVFRNTFLYGVISSVITILIYCVLYWLFFVLMRGTSGAGRALAFFYFPSALYTCALTPILYLALSPLKRKLNKAEQLD